MNGKRDSGAVRTIPIMSGGTGGYIFSSGTTRAALALAFTEDMAVGVSKEIPR